MKGRVGAFIPRQPPPSTAVTSLTRMETVDQPHDRQMAPATVMFHSLPQSVRATRLWKNLWALWETPPPPVWDCGKAYHASGTAILRLTHFEY